MQSNRVHASHCDGKRYVSHTTVSSVNSLTPKCSTFMFPLLFAGCAAVRFRAHHVPGRSAERAVESHHQHDAPSVRSHGGAGTDHVSVGCCACRQRVCSRCFQAESEVPLMQGLGADLIRPCCKSMACDRSQVPSVPVRDDYVVCSSRVYPLR